MVLQILIARWCLADIIVLSAVVPLNITISPLENGDKSTVSHSSCPPFHCCLLAPLPEYLVKFNLSQRREAGFRAMFPNTALLLQLWKKAGLFFFFWKYLWFLVACIETVHMAYKLHYDAQACQFFFTTFSSGYLTTIWKSNMQNMTFKVIFDFKSQNMTFKVICCIETSQSSHSDSLGLTMFQDSNKCQDNCSKFLLHVGNYPGIPKNQFHIEIHANPILGLFYYTLC